MMYERDKNQSNNFGSPGVNKHTTKQWGEASMTDKQHVKRGESVESRRAWCSAPDKISGEPRKAQIGSTEVRLR